MVRKGWSSSSGKDQVGRNGATHRMTLWHWWHTGVLLLPPPAMALQRRPARLEVRFA